MLTTLTSVQNRNIVINKEPKSTYELKVGIPKNVNAVIGHTRHATQGSHLKNKNNHPFSGKCGRTKFALAHNGIISNDRELRKAHNLKHTTIETDSYVAVQLLEKESLILN